MGSECLGVPAPQVSDLGTGPVKADLRGTGLQGSGLGTPWESRQAGFRGGF